MDEYHKDNDKVIGKVLEAYQGSIDDINKQMSDILKTFTASNKISLEEAKQYLTTAESKDFIENLKNTIANVQDEDLKAEMLRQINTPAYRARLTRLQAMKEKLNIECKALADIQVREIEKGLINTANTAYYKTIFDMQHLTGIGFSFAEIPTKQIEEILKNNWSGKHFSKRIWQNTDMLASELEHTLTKGFMTGASVQRMSKEIADKMEIGEYAATRLIRTETTYVANMAELEAYKETGVEKIMFLATLDLRTSKVCRKHDKEIIPLEKAVPGENIPPLHPNCRSTTIEIFEDDDLSKLQRRARDPETGKNKTVPADMNYKDWYKENVLKEPSTTGRSLKAVNKNGKEIEFELDNMKDNRAELVKNTITELSSKYNTRLIGVTNEAAAKKGIKGSVGLDFKMNLSTTKKDTIVHEFAHSLSMTNADKLGLTNDKEFWKEIKKVRTQYNKAVVKDASKKISNYSLESLDEFMAEAFAQSYLKNTNELGWEFGSDYEYADKVLEIIDKYFKK